MKTREPARRRDAQLGVRISKRLMKKLEEYCARYSMTKADAVEAALEELFDLDEVI